VFSHLCIGETGLRSDLSVCENQSYVHLSGSEVGCSVESPCLVVSLYTEKHQTALNSQKSESCFMSKQRTLSKYNLTHLVRAQEPVKKKKRSASYRSTTVNFSLTAGPLWSADHHTCTQTVRDNEVN